MESSKELIQYSKKMIRKGSKSFALASFFFAEKERAGSWLLYSWCRYADDLIDLAENKTEALKRLQSLETETAKCFDQNMSLEYFDTPELKGLAVVAREFQIPARYALDLLRGMRMDVEGREYKTIEELLEYCYCVAGTVGLMMCHIMGLSRTEALDNAVCMGNAMQLTNISRDVLDDWNLGRIYFPQEWQKDYGLTKENFLQPDSRRLLSLMTKRLLNVADQNYYLGWRGLDALPFRAAWAVGVAGQVYSRIGVKVAQKKEKAWDQRCYVTLSEKIFISFIVTLKLCVRFAPRLFRPWKAKPITRTWSSS